VTPAPAPAAAAPEGKTAEPVNGLADGATTEAKPVAQGTTEAEDAAKASEAAKALAARKQSAQERINNAVRAQREAERARDRAEARARELEAKLTKPDPEKFTDLSELNAAQVEHTLGKRDAARLTEDAKAAAREADEAARDAWQERVSVFKETAADFEDVAYNAPISEQVASDILRMEDGPQVAYYLGKNPKEARALNALSERERGIALGRLAGKIAAEPPRRTTQAPPPITGAVTGKSAPAMKWASLSPEDYAKAVAKEDAERRRR
jgi:hypothetical protein